MPVSMWQGAFHSVPDDRALPTGKVFVGQELDSSTVWLWSWKWHSNNRQPEAACASVTGACSREVEFHISINCQTTRLLRRRISASPPNTSIPIVAGSGAMLW